MGPHCILAYSCLLALARPYHLKQTVQGPSLQAALRRAIATRSGSCAGMVDRAGWVVPAPRRRGVVPAYDLSHR